jgi:hypothetical protein
LDEKPRVNRIQQELCANRKIDDRPLLDRDRVWPTEIHEQIVAPPRKAFS